MRGKKRVTIDVFPESAFRHLERDAIVCMDIVRTTTTLITSVSLGRPSFPAPDVKSAMKLASCLDDPLLAGEIGGEKPQGFEIHNSPATLYERRDIWRPLILVSTSGTQLITNSAECSAVYLASFQNLTATAEHIAAKRHERVALLGAGAGGEFRCEDQIASARIAAMLMKRGFEAEDMRTSEIVERWSGADVSLIGLGNSAAHLRMSNQMNDLDFILDHLDDLDSAYCLQDNQSKPLWRRDSLAAVVEAGESQTRSFPMGRRLANEAPTNF